MADPIFIKESLISQAELDFDDMHCPECHSNARFSLFGFTKVSREETYEDGKIVTVKKFNDKPTYELINLYCYMCNTKFTIANPLNYALQKTNLELNSEIQRLTNNKSDPLHLGVMN